MIIGFQGKHPKVDPTAFIAGNALVIGDVEIGPGTNIWFNCVVRGDFNYIRIGSNCNIQDACILHVEKDLYPLFLEDEVVLGHRVVVHGCRIKRRSLVGVGAIVLNNAEIGEESIVGAGSVVTPNTVIPPRTLALGTPAKAIRSVDEKDLESIRYTLEVYQNLKEIYRSLLSHEDKPR
ncbi:MAG: gamma carbonic anhydrase family protein [Syntrophaceae bacterium]|nr:gamma carbonic anhydrase family protein [Syntrophaceae bacterium]